MPLFFRELVGSTQRLATGYDCNFVERIGVRQEIRNQCMPGFVHCQPVPFLWLDCQGAYRTH